MSSKASAKFVEEIGKLSVFELAELIKEIEQAFGVSAAAPVASAASSAESAAPVAAAKTEFKVILKDAGSEKVKVIRALRQIKKDLGVTEARALVDEVPSVVVELAPKDEAENMKKLLEEAGAKVELA